MIITLFALTTQQMQNNQGRQPHDLQLRTTQHNIALTMPIEVCVLKDSVAGVILGDIKSVWSLTAAPMVNVATRSKSKRPPGPQEILSKSLVDFKSHRGISIDLHYDPTPDIISARGYYFTLFGFC
ncbi:hypothetical protein PoB_003025200 [Plakobranchus ocellatus]|uniref:Uncharacterized protein n=1 Tax=Plakobranchus ocellatus TaxID=259542 RepID=A0AAV4AA37_9GAST|nr:hypothetical protein PoB_003025200 [Plakobranchus ocellatus]